MAARESQPTRGDCRKSAFSIFAWMICLMLIVTACNPSKEDEFGYNGDESDLEGETHSASGVITPGKAFDEACDYADYQPVTDLFVYDVPAIREPQPGLCFMTLCLAPVWFG